MQKKNLLSIILLSDYIVYLKYVICYINIFQLNLNLLTKYEVVNFLIKYFKRFKKCP